MEINKFIKCPICNIIINDNERYTLCDKIPDQRINSMSANFQTFKYVKYHKDCFHNQMKFIIKNHLENIFNIVFDKSNEIIDIKHILLRPILVSDNRVWFHIMTKKIIFDIGIVYADYGTLIYEGNNTLIFDHSPCFNIIVKFMVDIKDKIKDMDIQYIDNTNNTTLIRITSYNTLIDILLKITK